MIAGTYAGARIGAERMNKLLEYAKQRGEPIRTSEAAELLGIVERTASKYLHRMVECGRLETLSRPTVTSPFYFVPVNGAEPFPLRPRLGDLQRKSRRLAEAERAERRQARKMAASLLESALDGKRKIIRTSAVQLGVKRDDMLQALFGDWRAA